MFLHEVRDNASVNFRGLDYIAATDLTASNVFSPSQVGVGELVLALRRHQEASEVLNKFKKALFRKQSRLDAGLTNMFSGLSIEASVLAGHDDLFHGIIGVATESGELCEYLADVLLGKRKFDQTPVREEIGDVLWYLSRLMKWGGTSFLTEMKRNIAKLRLRHGTGGFDKSRDMNRDLAAEHNELSKEQK